MKTIARTVRWSAVFLCFVLGSNIVLIAIYKYPQNSYVKNNRKYPLSMDCNELKPGMDLSSALTILARHGEPSLQRITGSKLVSLRGNIVCSIELDLAANRVTGVNTQSVPEFRWEE